MLQGWVGNERYDRSSESGAGDIEKGDILRSSSLPSSVESVMQAAASRVKEILEREGYTQISIYEEHAGDGRTQASSSTCGMINRNKSECKASHAKVWQESRRHSIS